MIYLGGHTVELGNSQWIGKWNLKLWPQSRIHETVKEDILHSTCLSASVSQEQEEKTKIRNSQKYKRIIVEVNN